MGKCRSALRKQVSLKQVLELQTPAVKLVKLAHILLPIEVFGEANASQEAEELSRSTVQPTADVNEIGVRFFSITAIACTECKLVTCFGGQIAVAPRCIGIQRVLNRSRQQLFRNLIPLLD